MNNGPEYFTLAGYQTDGFRKKYKPEKNYIMLG